MMHRGLSAASCIHSPTPPLLPGAHRLAEYQSNPTPTPTPIQKLSDWSHRLSPSIVASRCASSSQIRIQTFPCLHSDSLSSKIREGTRSFAGITFPISDAPFLPLPQPPALTSHGKVFGPPFAFAWYREAQGKTAEDEPLPGES